MTAKAIARLERGLEDELGVPVALERPSNPEHGDYATNAAMRAAPMKRIGMADAFRTRESPAQAGS